MRANQSTQRKPCPTASLSTTNNMWTGVGSNPGLHGLWPTTICPSQGVAYVRSVLATYISSLCAATEQEAKVQQAAASHNTQNVCNCGCRKSQLQISASSNAHGYLMQNTEMFTEGTQLYMVRVMDNIHIIHTYITYVEFDNFK